MSKVKVSYLILIMFLASACATTIDESLPYTDLPEIQLAAKTKLFAAPGNAMSALTSSALPVGKRLNVIGSDKDRAWWLVMADNQTLGWIPTIFVRDGVANLESAVVIDPLPLCASFLGTADALDAAWASTSAGSVIVQGSIYLPQTAPSFADALLTITTNSGTVTASDYVHLPLTASSTLILFTAAIDNVQVNSTIAFDLSTVESGSYSFQAAFFSDGCGDKLKRSASNFTNKLPVSQPKSVHDKATSELTHNGPVTTSSATPPISATVALSTTQSGATSAMTPTPTPTITPTPTRVVIARSAGIERPRTVCANTYQTRLFKGQIARVITDSRINVRSDPITRANNVVGKIEVQDMVTLLDGPECGQEMVWWYVRSSRDIVGWVSEGVADEYFLAFHANGTGETVDASSVREDNSSSSANTYPELRTSLLAKAQRSSVRIENFAPQRERFIQALIDHLNDFNQPGLNAQTMSSALQSADAGDRVNGAVRHIWKDWVNNANSRGFNVNSADPGSLGFTPFRQLVIRLIQDRQGRLAGNQQRALYSYFTRRESSHVWNDDMKSVIGAINREHF